MPECIRAHIESNESFTVTGVQNRGEGADFIHESTNRTIKSFLPPGTPTPEVWRRVTRNVNDLNTIKELITSNAVGHKKYRCKLFEREETLLRKSIRKSGISSMPESHNSLRSIDGKMLDYDLCDDIKHIAQENYATFKADLVSTGRYQMKCSRPIFITPEDREEYDKIENKKRGK